MARAKVLKKKAETALKKGRIADAGKLYEQASKQDAGDAELWAALGDIRIRQGMLAEALQHLQNAFSINSQDAVILSNLGKVYSLLNHHAEAQQHLEKAIQIDPSLAEAYFNLGNLCREQSAFDAAEMNYTKAVRLDPDIALAHYYLGNMLKTQGRVDEAIESYENALKHDPALIEPYWNNNRVLPVIIDNVEQLKASRARYEKGLDSLEQSLDLNSKNGKQAALRGLMTSTNFYLQYQGCDDLDLQIKFGKLLSKVMSENYPQWSNKLEKRSVPEGEKIRIGYVSAFLRDHNGAVWLLGWLRHCNKDQFEIYCYHTGSKQDVKTSEFKSHSDHFYYIPSNIDNLCKRIAKDHLDILVYPELGMDPQTMATASLRLAPIQCVGWGHPITSGLSTMDYWLSSDLMEPENGQDHYSEKLIRLPNMANCYSIAQHDRLQSQPIIKQRKDFDLPDKSLLYFCSQSLFKYLPQYDYIWPEIAKRVLDCRFVFVAISSIYVVKRFMERIERVFDSYDLNAKDYCIMLNRQSPEDYLILNRLMDVFLDNPPWSGNNTGLAAIDSHLPIVCYPTEFMRGRHSYAILKMIGVTEIIADSLQGYIEIAAKLGNDNVWRKEIVNKIANNHSLIYEDTECVEGLEDFYKKACKNI